MNIHETPFPVTVDELLDALDKAFPQRCPSLTDGDREVWFKAGQADVTKFLQRWKTASEEKGPSRNVRPKATPSRGRGQGR